MTLPPAPFRFLLLVVGCWVGVRAIALLPGAFDEVELATEAAPVTPAQARSPPPFASPAGPAASLAFSGRPWPAPRHTIPAASSAMVQPASPDARNILSQPTPPTRPFIAAPAFSPAPPARPDPPRWFEPTPVSPLAFSPSRAPGTSRWAGSAWLFVRDENGSGTLAPGGTLGGSQAGLRLTYRLNTDPRRALSLSARLYTPLDNVRAAEAALGIDWRPIATLPINLLAERRQAIGRDGRSDFALMLHGGAETHIANGRIRIQGYGQAGIVGIEQRDLFADGAITATARIGPFDVGGGAWGGAQPGARRLDVGPHASFRLPMGRVTIRAAADWRFRISGDAAPNSGPALTISAGF